MTDKPPSRPDLAELLREADRVHAESARLTEDSERLRSQAEGHARPTEHAGAVRIEVIAFDSCPKLPATMTNLMKAMQVIGLNATVAYIEQDALPESDARRCWPSPTLLVNGRDLFGMGWPPASGELPGCREYPQGVPTEQQIVARLQIIGC